MAQIGKGYGSEWHLLRFLGHHRHQLENEIKVQLKLGGECVFNWLDFEFDDRDRVVSGDKELTGLGFLRKQSQFPEYPTGWESTQSWDAVVYINDTLYLVEAKAHVSEIYDKKNNHGGKSRTVILDFMSKQMTTFGCNVNVQESTWLGDYYQMANRLAVAAYLNNKNIPTKVLYIYFEDGYYMDDGNNLSATKEDFLKEIAKEKKTLGIDKNSQIKKILCEVFINANPIKK